jgi:hypothetical protein
MIEKKWARLAYSHSFNLGDMTQTLATEKILDDEPISIERHELKNYDGPEARLIMQGYFFNDDFHCTFPPSDKIEPIFFGFHVEDTKNTKEYFSTEEIVSYLKKFQPIGCRDVATVSFLENLGIEAYFSRCMTLTFATREKEPKNGKVFFIDPPKWLKARKLFGDKFNTLFNGAVHLGQIVDEDFKLSDVEKSEMARERLDLIKNQANLVVTSRLHIAAPCLAMGIPVVIIPRTTTPIRYEAIEGLSKIYWPPTRDFVKFGFLKNYVNMLVRVIYVRFLIDWSPKKPNIETEKLNILQTLNQHIKKMSGVL